MQSGKEYIINVESLTDIIKNNDLIKLCYLKIVDDFNFVSKYDIKLCFKINSGTYFFHYNPNNEYQINTMSKDNLKFSNTDFVFPNEYELILSNSEKFRYYYNDKPFFMNNKYSYRISQFINNLYHKHIDYKYYVMIKIFDYHSNKLYYECKISDDHHKVIQNDVKDYSNDIKLNDIIFRLSFESYKPREFKYYYNDILSTLEIFENTDFHYIIDKIFNPELLVNDDDVKIIKISNYDSDELYYECEISFSDHVFYGITRDKIVICKEKKYGQNINMNDIIFKLSIECKLYYFYFN
jgi:hypothetical protein